MLFQSFAKSPSPAQLLPTVLTPSPNIYPPLNFFKKIEKFIYRGILPESFALGNEKTPPLESYREIETKFSKIISGSGHRLARRHVTRKPCTPLTASPSPSFIRLDDTLDNA